METSELPLKRNLFMRWIGRAILKLMGWKVQGSFPQTPKAVLIAAPHTSNWDFIVGVAAKFYLELSVHWLGKHTLFRKPFDIFFRWLGGIPVERGASTGMVEQTIETLKRHKQFLLALSPEGTRRKVNRWKTGFYQIARGAEVPIIPVSFDYSKRIIQIGDALYPSDSMETDFGKLKTFYADVDGKYPENFSTEIYHEIAEHTE